MECNVNECLVKPQAMAGVLISLIAVRGLTTSCDQRLLLRRTYKEWSSLSSHSITGVNDPIAAKVSLAWSSQ